MSNEWGDRLRDAILENSALRDGLSDTEAQPLIDWGLALADQVTAGLEFFPPEDAEMRYEELYGSLPKLLTRITWLTLHRVTKGEEWATKTLNQMNEFNQTLCGQNAPQIPPDLISHYATAADGLSNGDLVLTLMERLSPPPDPTVL